MLKQLREWLRGDEKDKLPLLTDYTNMAVDIHSHLIPGIDDGSQDMDTTISMLTKFKALGFRKIITSPHVVSDGYNNSTETILKGRDKVREAIQKAQIDIEFDATAEYYLDESLIPKIEKKDLLPFGRNYLLVELSYLHKANNVADLIYRLQVAGYRVILAHPERYPYYYEKDFATYKSFVDRNVLLQLNIASLSGKYGQGAKATAEKLIDENMISFLGSDLHTLRQFESLAQCVSLKHIQKLLHSEKLLNKTL